MKITLQEWAERHLSKPPKLATLRAWAKAGRIQPAPVKTKGFWVDENAELVDIAPCMEPLNLSPRALEILRSVTK